jgi:hypothetical protein
LSAIDLWCIKWCGALESSSAVGAAVPICISLKNCLESAEIISVLKCCASLMLSAVLPIAVGPTIAIRYFVFASMVLIFQIN